MKPNRRWFKTFIGETLEYKESEQIPPDHLAEMVGRLRLGDTSVIDSIIKGHLRLVVSVVSDLSRSSRLSQDIEGAALLALVEAVHDCCPHYDSDDVFHDSRLIDNNITYYIISTVQWAIKDEYSNAHVMRMPRRTINYKLAQGAKYEDIIPGDGIGVRSDRIDAGSIETNADLDGYSHHHNAGDYIMPYFIPLAKMEYTPIEFDEIINRAAEGLQQQEIVRLRIEGHNYKEVGEIVGLTTGRVGQIVPQIEERFNKLYK